jgi:peptidoglycan/LPS O-acetylase OafA/YrhL
VPVILLIYVLAVIAASTVAWKVIELPSIALGRVMSKKLDSKR